MVEKHPNILKNMTLPSLRWAPSEPSLMSGTVTPTQNKMHLLLMLEREHQFGLFS